MKSTIGALLVVAMIGAGCSWGQRSTNTAYNPSLMEITPAPAPIAHAPPQPIAYEPPPAPQPIATSPPAAGGRYLVQKGDTLWKIAHTQYGNGNHWPRIVSANPGLTPETLKAGQTIVLP